MSELEHELQLLKAELHRKDQSQRQSLHIQSFKQTMASFKASLQQQHPVLPKEVHKDGIAAANHNSLQFDISQSQANTSRDDVLHANPYQRPPSKNLAHARAFLDSTQGQPDQSKILKINLPSNSRNADQPINVLKYHRTNLTSSNEWQPSLPKHSEFVTFNDNSSKEFTSERSEPGQYANVPIHYNQMAYRETESNFSGENLEQSGSYRRKTVIK